jgi:DNA gyrase/topoisomerase IV subunit B
MCADRQIEVLEAAEAVRRRCEMYLGEPAAAQSWCARLVEHAVHIVTSDTPPPSDVRLVLWADSELTVAFDGEPLPIAPCSFAPNQLPQPEIYRMFLLLGVGARHHAFSGLIVNALSERLVAWTTHAGERYRAAFSRGRLTSSLEKSRTDGSLGTNGFTFRPDASVVPGRLSVEDADHIIRAAQRPGMAVTLNDRTNERASWS